MAANAGGGGRTSAIVVVVGLCLVVAISAWSILSHPGPPDADDVATATVNEADSETAEDGGANAATGTDSHAPTMMMASGLDAFSDQELAELESALQAWKTARGIDADAETQVVGAPNRTSLGTSLILRIPSADVYLTAQLANSGSWSLTRLVEKLPGIDGGIADGGLADVDDGTFDPSEAYEGVALVSQHEALMRYLPSACVDSLADDMEAAGIRSAGAWVDVTTIERSADAASFKVFVPIYIDGGEDCEIWKAAWSVGAGTAFERLD